MTNYLKWAIPGGVALLIAGVVIGAHSFSGSSAPEATVREKSAPAQLTLASYPKPQVSIQTQPITSSDDEALTRSASFYDSSDVRWVKHSKHSKHSHSHAKKVTGIGGIDTEMGYMPADDAKLKAAEKEAEKHDTDGYKDWTTAGPSGQ